MGQRRLASGVGVGAERREDDHVRPRPRKWEHYDLATNCVTSNYPRLIHDPKTWEFIQDAHAHSRGRRRHRDGRRPHHGFRVGFEVRDDGPRGRSVYAAEFIPRGTEVYRGERVVRFDEPSELTDFLALLPHDLQCDVLLWAFPGSRGQAYVALDEGSFVNHGETKALVTLDSKCRATRDIKPGEELLENYEEFVGTSPGWFSELREGAWAEKGAKRAKDDSNTRVSVDQYVKRGAPEHHHHPGVRWNDDDDNDGDIITSRYPLETRTILITGAVLALFLYRLKLMLSRRKKRDV